LTDIILKTLSSHALHYITLLLAKLKLYCSLINPVENFLPLQLYWFLIFAVDELRNNI